MQFYTGARHKDIKYVVDQTVVEKDAHGRTIRRVPGLYARFENHRFNSKKAQRQLNWTDAQREQVEQFLLNHDHFRTADKGRRIYVLNDNETASSPAVVKPVEDATHPCAMVWENEDGDVERCPNVSIVGSLYCENHSKETADTAA